MAPCPFTRIRRLVLAAVELPPQQRGPFLDRACAGDVELRREIESLLNHESDDDSLFGLGATLPFAHQSAFDETGATGSLTGTTISRFLVGELVGRGGMGDVYRAVDTRLGRTVAIKILLPVRQSDPRAERRFQTEVRAISRLDGTGATLAYLAGRGYRRLIGIDREHTLLRLASHRADTTTADICNLPFGSASFDLVLTECAWNLTDRKLALAEFYRVLRPGGTLAVSDIHLRAQDSKAAPWPVRCCFEQAESLEKTVACLKRNGFSVRHVEEMNQLLSRAAAEFVFTHGSLDNFWRAVTGDDALAAQACAAAAKTRPGLFLLIATRGEE